MKQLFVLMLAITAMITGNAQERRIPRERGEFRDKMLTEKLKLSEEQKQKAKTLNEDFRKKMMELRKKDDITVKDYRNQMMELNKKHREEMRDLLSKEQKDQIEKFKVEKRKMAGIDADARLEKMKLRLDLNNDQVEKLKRQRAETLEKMKDIRENNKMDMMKKREEMKFLMQQRKKNLKSILTEEQMKRMQELNKPMHRKRRILS